MLTFKPIEISDSSYKERENCFNKLKANSVLHVHPSKPSKDVKYKIENFEKWCFS
jgi:hypothetical protein